MKTFVDFINEMSRSSEKEVINRMDGHFQVIERHIFYVLTAKEIDSYWYKEIAVYSNNALSEYLRKPNKRKPIKKSKLIKAFLDNPLSLYRSQIKGWAMRAKSKDIKMNKINVEDIADKMENILTKIVNNIHDEEFIDQRQAKSLFT